MWDIFISPEVLVLAFWCDLSNLLLNMFCFWYCFLSFVLFLISTVCELFFFEEVSCFRLWDIFISPEVLVLVFWFDISNLLLNMFCFWYCFLSSVLFLISTVCELFFFEEVSCFRLWDIFISPEVLVLVFWFDISNLLLNMFCFWYCFLSSVLFLISTVCELFFFEEVSCFRLWDIFISPEVLVLVFWFDISNLLLNMFCFWYCFLSFVLFLISTVCELFFSEEVSYFRLWDIFISPEVLLLAFWSDLSNLLLNMFCFCHCFLSFVLFLISTICELFFSEEVSCFRLWDIFISPEVLVLVFWFDISNLLLNMFCFCHCFLSFVLFLISTVCELFFSEEVSYFRLWDIFISPEVLLLAFWSDLSNLLLNMFCFCHCFLSFVLFLISTICELFFSEEVSCFRLWDIFISPEVLVLAFWYDLLFILCNYHRCQFIMSR